MTQKYVITFTTKHTVGNYIQYKLPMNLTCKYLVYTIIISHLFWRFKRRNIYILFHIAIQNLYWDQLLGWHTCCWCGSNNFHMKTGLPLQSCRSISRSGSMRPMCYQKLSVPAGLNSYVHAKHVYIYHNPDNTLKDYTWHISQWALFFCTTYIMFHLNEFTLYRHDSNTLSKIMNLIFN